MRNPRAALLIAALGVLALGGQPWQCECEETGFAPPKLEVDKTALLFEGVAVGYPQTRVLTVFNKGGVGLSLDRVEIEGGQSSPFSVLGYEEGDQVNPQLPQVLGPGAFIRLVVQYDPADEQAQDNDTLILDTNDPDPCNPEDLTLNPCRIALSGSGAPPNAELEVVCQQDDVCPEPGEPPVCQVMLDAATNTHPQRLSLNFCQVAAGYSRQLDALLRNAGNIPLTLDGFELFGIVGEVEDFGLLSPEQKSVEIPPQGEIMLSVVYAPEEEGADNAGIDLTTNDTDIPNGEFSVRMLAYSAEPDIDVNPMHIPFEGVVQGSQASETITINNIGTGVLEVSGIELSGGSLPGEFSLDSTDGFTVDPMGQHTITVTYHPQDAGRDDGAVVIHSNDPDEPQVTVTLGAEVRPDLEVTPSDWVEFTGVELGGSASEKVTLRNVGYAELHITSIGFNPQYNPGDPPVFGVSGLPADFPQNPIVLQPAEAFEFNVDFTDNPAMENELGQLEIGHDSPNDPNPYILLAVNQGTPANLPPVAVIDPPSQAVSGLQQVTLDGSNSFDPDPGDTITRYQWSMLFVPQDAQGNQSQATLDSTDQPTTTFTPDMPGKYIVRLVVFDSFNTASQPTDSEISVSP